jgi:uncharacterized protein
MIYQDINAIFEKSDGDFSAAESHGIATGILCVSSNADSEFWLQELQQDSGGFNADDLVILEELFEETRNLLINDEFTFQPLLPSEFTPIDEQVEAMRDWCMGFLFGIGSSSPKSDWPEEIRDVIKDITEYTKLESSAEEDNTENELMELTEYLRAAVIFLHTEFNSTDDRTVH